MKKRVVKLNVKVLAQSGAANYSGITAMFIQEIPNCSQNADA
jgi:hypothetical protein